MANPNDRVPENLPGAFYVDDSCVDCDTCRSIAPQFFIRHDGNGYTYVHRQPATAEETALAQEALEGCPTESIGNDGASPEAPLFSALAQSQPSPRPASSTL